MAEFEVKIRAIQEIYTHPNADRLDIAQIDGYQFIVLRDQYKVGDLGVYIPEFAIVPNSIIEEMGLTGKLAGKLMNRVKAIRLRGTLSQGLFYVPDNPNSYFVTERDGGRALLGVDGELYYEGDDVGASFGIVKYVPPVPIELQGQIVPAPQGIFDAYDVEDIKRFPGVIQNGEMVSMTEKLHGSCMIIGIIDGERFVTSKGHAERHFVLVESEKNAYWRVARQEGLFEKIQAYMDSRKIKQGILYGELVGVQDLKYGLKDGQLGFRAFDFLEPGGWVFPHEFLDRMARFGIPTVPEVYWGHFSQAVLDEHTGGKSKIAGHIREGVVVKPLVERRDPAAGRVAFKSISGDYLVRSNGTEFN
jgi:RNA ligase (TIGR02306 family)